MPKHDFKANRQFPRTYRAAREMVTVAETLAYRESFERVATNESLSTYDRRAALLDKAASTWLRAGRRKAGHHNAVTNRRSHQGSVQLPARVHGSRPGTVV